MLTKSIEIFKISMLINGIKPLFFIFSQKHDLAKIYMFMHSEIAIVISPVIIGELGIIVGLYKLIKVIENKNK